MKALAQWAMQSRLRVTAAAFVCMVLPVFFWLGAALIGLVILRQGWKDGRAILAWAVLPAIAWLSAGDPTPLLAVLGVSCCAGVLRQSVRLDKTLYAATAFGVGLYFIIPFTIPKLLALVTDNTELVFKQSFANNPEVWAQIQPLFEPLVAGIFAALHILAIILSLLLARYWQSELYNPNGFGQEFRRLRLSASYSVPAVIMLIGAASLGPQLVGLIPVLTVIMMLAGLALLHAIAAKKAGSFWMMPVYVALFIFGPYTYTLLILLALLDSFINLRDKVKDTAA